MSCWVVEFRAVIWFLVVSSALRVVYLHIKWHKSNKNQNRSQLLLRIVYIEALVHRSHFKCVLINSLKCHSEVRKMNGNALPIRSSGETPTTLCVCWFQWKWWHKNIDGFILRLAVISSLALDSARRNLSASNTRNISIDSFIAIRAKVLEAAPATHTKKRKNTERMEHKSMIKTTRIFIACRKKNYFRTKSLVNAYRRRCIISVVNQTADETMNDMSRGLHVSFAHRVFSDFTTYTETEMCTLCSTDWSDTVKRIWGDRYERKPK